MKTAIGVFIFFTLLYGCHRDANQLDHHSDLSPDVLEGKEIRMVYSDSAKVRMILTSPNMQNFDDVEDRVVFSGGVHVEFFDEHENKIADMRSYRATRFQRQAKIIAEKDVVLTKANGEKLESEELIWDERTNILRTDLFARITRGREIMEGFGFEAKDDFKTFTIVHSIGKQELPKPKERETIE